MRLLVMTGFWTTACLLCMSGGCGSSTQSSADMEFNGGTGGIEMQPQWRRFALENYRGMVLADLPPTARDTAKFPEPQIIAAPLPGGGVELLAAGVVNSKTLAHHGIQREYGVRWKKSFGGWELVDTYVSDPKEFEPPVEKEPLITVGPKTQPTTAPQ